MIDKLVELRMPGGMWDETTQKFNDFFSTTKKNKQLQSSYSKITNYKPSRSSPCTWTEEQCKELLIEIEEPGTMNFKILAERSIFNGKNDNQVKNKTDKLRVKKKLYLSAAATKTGEASGDYAPIGAVPSICGDHMM